MAADRVTDIHIGGTAEATLAAVNRFNQALNAHDLEAVMAAMTDDCVFENTAPAPDGTRFVGRPAVRAYWAAFLTQAPDARFTVEEMLVSDDRAVVRWIYHKTKDGLPWHLRGWTFFASGTGKSRRSCRT